MYPLYILISLLSVKLIRGNSFLCRDCTLFNCNKKKNTSTQNKEKKMYSDTKRNFLESSVQLSNIKVRFYCNYWKTTLNVSSYSFNAFNHAFKTHSHQFHSTGIYSVWNLQYITQHSCILLRKQHRKSINSFLIFDCLANFR